MKSYNNFMRAIAIMEIICGGGLLIGRNIEFGIAALIFATFAILLLEIE